MNSKTKLIVGLACCAFLAIGIAQPLWLPKSLSSTGAVISYDNQTNKPLRYSVSEPTNGLEELERFYPTNAYPRYAIAANHGPYTNCTWTVSEDTPTLTMTISTNNSVNWVTIEHDPQAAVISAKQVGTVQTNRILTVIHDGATNLVLLKILGKEEWPSQTRVVQGRRQ